MFSSKISKNTYFEEYLRLAASEVTLVALKTIFTY